MLYHTQGAGREGRKAFGLTTYKARADMDPMKRRALEQVKMVGRKGLMVLRGWESRTQMALVEDGMLWQEHGGPHHWKFTLSPSGERALSNTHQ